MLFFKMAIAVACILCGFSVALTGLFMIDKETPHKLKEILVCLLGVLLFVVGIILLQDA